MGGFPKTVLLMRALSKLKPMQRRNLITTKTKSKFVSTGFFSEKVLGIITLGV